MNLYAYPGANYNHSQIQFPSTIRMIILLSPSKGQNFDVPTPARVTRPTLLDDSAKLVDTLRGYNEAEIGELMSISEKLATLNAERYREFSTPFTKKNAKPALLAFRGDVYTGIEASEYSDDDWTFAQDHLRILSGLYGALRPLDLIQPYRLEMKTRLKTGRGDNLYEFWGDKITDELNKTLKKQKSRLVINLASNEYFKSINKRRLEADVVDIVFREVKDSKSRTIALFAKQARGNMANYLIRNRITDIKGVQQFRFGGYRFKKSESSASSLVFSRKQPPPVNR